MGLEQLVILVVLGVVAFVKWLLEKSAELRERDRTEKRLEQLEREQPAPPVLAPRPIARPLPDIEAAERRLRDALGLPSEPEAPPVKKVQKAPPPVPEFVPQTPVIRHAPLADLEQRTVTPALSRKRAAFRMPSAKPETPVPAARSGLQDLLGSREGLRKAILAQEVLGTPKGLVF